MRSASWRVRSIRLMGRGLAGLRNLLMWRSAAWVAICCESLVELNDALRNMAIQRQGEEDLFRYSLMAKPLDVLEPEAPVVLRMPHEAASPGTKVLQT